MPEPSIRLVELTNGQQRKPWKVQNKDTCSLTLAFVLKTAKNKFRSKYRFLQYLKDPNDTCGQPVISDHDLQRILQKDDGAVVRFLVTNQQSSASLPLVIHNNNNNKAGGLSYVIGNAQSTNDAALKQLRHASELEGCCFAIGMPDLHPGRGIPIGAVVLTREDIAYPQLVDNDIGCGTSFVQTNLATGGWKTAKLQKLANSIRSIDGPHGTVDDMRRLCSQPLSWAHHTFGPLPKLQDCHYQNLGTVGGGNHFAELQEFHQILDADAIRQHGIDPSKLHMLVHSGSRGFGSQVLRNFCQAVSEQHANDKDNAKTTKQRHGHWPIDTNSTLFQTYKENHDVALNYAVRNRHLIAQRLLNELTGEMANLDKSDCKIDIHHNYLELADITDMDAIRLMSEGAYFPKSIPPSTKSETVRGWVHRKGATPTNQSPVLVIPGSRGTLSYLCEVNPAAQHGCGFSLAHGAGRCMTRAKAKTQHQNRYPQAQKLLQTDLGGIVVCEKKNLLYEEAPQSYKDIDDVVKCLSQDVQSSDGKGIVRVLATLRPLLTYKYKDPYNP